MTTTTPTSPVRPRGRWRHAALAGAVALGTLVGLVPGATPAGAAPPSPIDIVGALGYDQPGPTGQHVISWKAPESTGGKPVIEYQIEVWRIEPSEKVATYNQSAQDHPHFTIGGMPDEAAFRYRVRARNADGWSGWGGFEATKVTVGRTHLRPFGNPFEFVNRQVDDFGVTATQGQRSTWATSLTGRSDVESFLTQMATRPERANRPKVIRLYYAYFNRSPEPEGLAYWQHQLDSGAAGLGKVSQFFAQSQEFTTIYGGTTNAQFVTLVYQNVLFRNPDSGGMTYWKGRLDAGTLTRGNLMVQFSESAEGRNLRHPDVTASDMWLTTIRTTPSKALVKAYAAHVRAGASAGDLALLFLPLNSYPQF